MGNLSIQLLLVTGMLILVLTIGVPISFALGFVSVIGILMFLSSDQLLHLATIAYSQSTSINLMVIPLFLLMAEFLAISGIAKDLIRLAHHFFKKIPGGLLISTVIGCAGFSSVCGSSTATVTTLGVVSIPELIRQEYNKKFVAGAVVAGGTLGVLIPPSIAFILYGIITEMPIATLFIAGIIPGIMTTVLLCMYIFIRVKMTPSLAPLTLESEKQEIETNRWLLLLKMTPVILLALIIFIFIYTGVATPTEIGAVGAVGSILLTFCYRRFSWYKLKLILLGTVKTTSMLFFLAIGGMAFAYLLSFIGLPQYLIGLILDLGVNRWVIIVAINVLLLILGCFLDPVGMIVCLVK